MKKITDTIKYIDAVDKIVVGSCKAKDLQKKENIFQTLGIEWVDC